MLLFLLGCAPYIVAWPPPSALPGGQTEIGPHELELGFGGNAVIGLATEQSILPSFFPNYFSGPFIGQGRLGFDGGWDLTMGSSRHLLGPTTDVAVGRWFTLGPTLSVGPQIGVGGSYSEASYSTLEKVDASGNVVTPSVDVPYSYLSVAPIIAGRLDWHPSRIVSVPLLLRGSYSMVIPLQNAADRRMFWLDLMPALRFNVTRGFGVGLGPGAHLVFEAGQVPYAIFDAQLSIHGRFLTKRR